MTGTSGGDCYHLWARVDGGLGEQGGHTAAPPVCFGTEMKRYIALLDYMWLTHMHKCKDKHMHAHTLGLRQQQSLSQGSRILTQLTLTLLFDTLLSLTLFHHVPCLPKSLYGWLRRMRNASILCGLAMDQRCNPDKQNKSKKQSYSTN